MVIFELGLASAILLRSVRSDSLKRTVFLYLKYKKIVIFLNFVSIIIDTEDKFQYHRFQ
jgi:hypothetical protein